MRNGVGLTTHQSQAPNVLVDAVLGEEAISSLRDLRQSSPALTWDKKQIITKTPVLEIQGYTAIDSHTDPFASNKIYYFHPDCVTDNQVGYPYMFRFHCEKTASYVFQ